MCPSSAPDWIAEWMGYYCTTFFKPQRQSGFINHWNLHSVRIYMLATHLPGVQQENCWPHLQVESKLFQWCIGLERAVCCRADVYYVSACSVCVYSLLSFTSPSSRTSDKRLTLFCLCADVTPHNGYVDNPHGKIMISFRLFVCFSFW